MKDILVKELMVPLQEYATVSQNATLYEAVLALEKAQEEYLKRVGPQVYPHRAVLALDDKGRVVGKLSQLDIIKALEPKYQNLIQSDTLARTAASGFSNDLLRSMLDHYKLFDKPLHDLCRKAASIKAKNCMYSPSEGELVDVNDNLEVAVHQFIVGKHQSLLVTNKGTITGILRLTDVFQEVCKAIKECDIRPGEGQ